MTARRIAAAVAGPALIVLGVSFALRGFAFHDLLTNEHPDLLAFWLPRWAFLGRSVASGHVPVWNPYEMLGYPFAADPQSGWLYAPPMVLFSILSPVKAIRAMVVLNPSLAGLGSYAFLRLDGMERFASTAAGLGVAMMLATSELAVAMPFAGFLAWTTVVLVGAAGYRRATRWSRRLVWLAIAAFGWSQVAGAHLSHGLAMCTLMVTAYLVAHAVVAARSGETRPASATRDIALFLVVLPAASLAILVPRLAFISASSLGSGYNRLGDGVRSLVGQEVRPLATNGVWAGWPLAFGAAPGAYAGAALLLAIPLALRAPRRPLAWAFGGSLALAWLLTSNALVTAGWFRRSLLKLPYGDVFLHNPGRLRYVAVLAIPFLGAAGLQSLRDRPPERGELVRWLIGGVALFAALPLALGAHPGRFLLLLVALVPALIAIAGVSQGRPWGAPVVVAVLALELTTSAVLSSAYSGGTMFTGLESGVRPNEAPQPLRYPDVDARAFVRPTAFVGAIGDARYLTWAPPAAFYEKGYLFAQEPTDWPALANERGTLFGIRDALGYNPVQLPRYWAYVRTANDLSIAYNAAVLQRPTEQTTRVLGVRYLVVPERVPPPVSGEVVETADGYDLVRVRSSMPPVSLVSSWDVVATPSAALRRVSAPGFEPALTTIVESAPPFGPSDGEVPGSATVDEDSPGVLRLSVRAEKPSIVVIRQSYDPGWQATIDGLPVPILPTDAIFMGVAVAAGEHDVRLIFRDEALQWGAVGSALVWLMLGGSIVAAALLERRRRRASGRTKGLMLPHPSQPQLPVA